MIIRSIHLNNIRSYVNQKISFNEGISVLSGDIGSGKSSILLAVEFALFGINDSGDSLLRKGENDGFVELKFEINNQEYSIRRYLKRKSDGIRQANGYIITKDTKKDMTPVELKQFIITLLGYPQESVNKKPLIYRYTTYTPQDEMKQILYENSDERVNIIRKIFGIDKYQRIIENSTIFSRTLRENKRELIGKTSDLEMKKIELKKTTEEKDELIKKEKEADIRLIEAKKQTNSMKENIILIEQEIKKYNEIRREKTTLESSIKHMEVQENSIKTEIARLEDELIILKGKISPDKLERLKLKIRKEIKDEILNLEKQQLELQRIIGEFEAIKKQSEKTKSQISELDDCPLCLQHVHHEHKEKIRSSENERIMEAEYKLREAKDSTYRIKEELSIKNKELNESNEAEREISIMSIHIKNMNEKEIFLNEKKEIHNKLIKEISELKEKNMKIKLIDFEEKENQYNLMKKNYEKFQNAEREAEIEKIRMTTEMKNKEKSESTIKSEIETKEKIKMKISEMTNIENWLQNNFANIISIMEKHVLSSIYFAFNDYFKEMFELLIEDDRLSSRIDENFTPVIEQNSYETGFDNLSGGEKTSLCLAYRLALHKAINGMMSGINTRGLLLMDEPTDGFSNEQIDKMKDLFTNLNAFQTIIVSHENKIESIADHVVRIVKEGHESKVTA